MNTLFGYPVRLVLDVGSDEALDVSEALELHIDDPEMVVNTDRVLELISEHLEAQ